MAQKRALESPGETESRQEQNRTRMDRKQGLETPSETMSRQERNSIVWTSVAISFFALFVFHHSTVKFNLNFYTQLRRGFTTSVLSL